MSTWSIRRCMKLTIDEAAAINCHMGATPGFNAVRDSNNAFKASPLARVVYVAMRRRLIF